MIRCSVVIPTFGRCDLLARCLAAATRQDHDDYEVIVIDDASPDCTAAMVRCEYPMVLYLRQPSNRGPAAARNRGIAAASGEIIVFTDDDCLLPGDFVSRLVRGYLGYPQVSGVGGYLEAPEDVLARSLWAQYEAYRTHQVYHAGSQPYLGGFECPTGGTNAMSYRRQVLEAVGGFDERFPVPGGEDTDLKLRVTQRGGRLLYLPIKVTHLQPYTLRHFWRQYRTHGRGVPYYEQKHQGISPAAHRLVLRLGRRLLRWLVSLWDCGPRLATAQLIAELADLQGQWYEWRHSGKGVTG